MLLDVWKNYVVRREIPKCDACQGLVKPDIVFFGEDLPEKFHKMNKKDFAASDCLLVFGTSLKVGVCALWGMYFKWEVSFNIF